MGPSSCTLPKNPCSKCDYDDVHLTNALVDLDRDDRAFGFRFVADELELLDEFLGERRVWRLWSDMSIVSAFTEKGKKGKRLGAAVQHDFRTTCMNKL